MQLEEQAGGQYTHDTTQNKAAHLNGHTPELRARVTVDTQTEVAVEEEGEMRENGALQNGPERAGTAVDGGGERNNGVERDATRIGDTPHGQADQPPEGAMGERDSAQSTERSSREQEGSQGGTGKISWANAPPPLQIKRYPSNSLPNALLASGKQAVSPASATLSGRTKNVTNEGIDIIFQDLTSSPPTTNKPRPHSAEQGSPLARHRPKKNPTVPNRRFSDQHVPLPGYSSPGNENAEGATGRPISADQSSIPSAAGRPCFRSVGEENFVFHSADDLPPRHAIKQETSPYTSGSQLAQGKVLKHGRSQTQDESEETDL